MQFRGGICSDNSTVQLLVFADETVFLTQTEEDLQHYVKEFSEAVKQQKLVINVEIQGQKLANMRKKAYLSVVLSDNGTSQCKLKNRVGAALRGAGAVESHVFESLKLSRVPRCLSEG